MPFELAGHLSTTTAAFPMKALSSGNDHSSRAASPGTRRLRRFSITFALCLGLAAPAVAVAQTAATPSPHASEVKRTRSERDLAVRGIYLQQLTAQNPKKLRRLIDNAVKVGLNTFVVDLWGRAPQYAKGIKMIQDAGLSYVPRITMFPDGAKSEQQVADRALLEHRWGLVDYALKLGAKDIQLDYIRFSSRNEPSDQNAEKILEVVRFFRQRIAQRGARLQIDIFGEVSYGPSTRIGQDIGRFAPELHAVCPMLYPSHFEPYKETAKTPYKTVYGALTALERQTQKSPIPVYPYIEHFNYRYKMSDAERAQYFEAQLEAVLDSSRSQGFYVWSVGNYYDIVFNVLRRRARDRGEQGPLDGDLRTRADSVTGSTVATLGPPPPPEPASGPR